MPDEKFELQVESKKGRPAKHVFETVPQKQQVLFLGAKDLPGQTYLIPPIPWKPETTGETLGAS